MKKAVSVLLVVILLTAVAATCLAAVHSHTYNVWGGKTVENAWSGATTVQGCHNCTYRHTHYDARVTVTYLCSCGTSQTTSTYTDTVNKYCPYSH